MLGSITITSEKLLFAVLNNYNINWIVWSNVKVEEVCGLIWEKELETYISKLVFAGNKDVIGSGSKDKIHIQSF